VVDVSSKALLVEVLLVGVSVSILASVSWIEGDSLGIGVDLSACMMVKSAAIDA
jgi:hypothetical protein